MATATITFEVDAESARAFDGAPAAERRCLELLLALCLRELTAGPARPLREVMDEVGRRAEGRGLTADGLAELLRDG